MKLQEMLTIAVNGIIAQGALAKRPGTVHCGYRLDGLACAVGQLIDDATAQEWDMIGDIAAIRKHDELPAEFEEHHQFLADMQYAHDMAGDVDDFVASMAPIAQQYGLEMPA